MAEGGRSGVAGGRSEQGRGWHGLEEGLVQAEVAGGGSQLASSHVLMSYCMMSWRPLFLQPGTLGSCLYLASYTASAV